MKSVTKTLFLLPFALLLSCGNGPTKEDALKVFEENYGSRLMNNAVYFDKCDSAGQQGYWCRFCHVSFVWVDRLNEDTMAYGGILAVAKDWNVLLIKEGRFWTTDRGRKIDEKTWYAPRQMKIEPLRSLAKTSIDEANQWCRTLLKK